MTNELRHFGVLGMKWGVRKSREKAYRGKLLAISNNKSISGTSDEKRFKYRNQSLTKRVGKTAASGVTQLLIGEIINGDITKYGSMNKAQLTKELARKASMLTVTTAANVAINDALAKSASKRYTDSGKRISGTKDRLFTKEDIIDYGIGTAVKAAPFLYTILSMKVTQAAKNRVKNEQVFERWGQNILPESLGNVIWESEDLKYAIVDKKR